jgi:deazaflavin-dependent oxidoreductase (nitroreductase family)
MGVLQKLDYEVKPANAIQRAMQRVASTRAAAWVFQRTLYPIDRLLFRWTNGRLTVPGLVAGLPIIMLTTTGRKSGEPRTMPLVGVPVGDDVAVIGTNYGQQHTPGWVYNLEADPAATVAYRDRTVPVVARPSDDAESDRAFEQAGAVYPGYLEYRDRVTHRDIRVFVLEPARTGAG